MFVLQNKRLYLEACRSCPDAETIQRTTVFPSSVQEASSVTPEIRDEQTSMVNPFLILVRTEDGFPTSDMLAEIARYLFTYTLNPQFSIR